jgi:hypothetical protein
MEDRRSARAADGRGMYGSQDGNCLETADRQPHLRRGRPHPPRNLAGRHPPDLNLITSRTWRLASLSVGIQVPFAKPKGGTVSEPEEASSPRATSSRNGGRDHSGMVGDIERNLHPNPCLILPAASTPAGKIRAASY